MSSTPVIEIFALSTETALELPLVNGISAGFPSPAMDFLDQSIDLNKLLIKHPAATFLGRANGNSLRGAMIEDGDLMIIDRSITPTDGKIAVCVVDGEFTVKRIKIEANCLWLMPENENYTPIKVTEDNNFIIWGMVAHFIKTP